MKDEKILKKIGKLLKLYGAEPEEIEKFLLDVQDTKYDDQEEIEEADNEPVEEELPTEEGEVEEQPAEPVGDEVGDEEVVEEDEEVVEQPEQPAEPVEQPLPEEPTEEPLPQEPVEEPVVEEPQPNDEDTQKTIEGLLARIESLEDIVKKLGTPVEENIGVEPRNPSGESYVESEFDRYNKLRRG